MGAVYSLAGETADIGMDCYSPVTDDYDPWDNAFTGTINTVKVKHKTERPQAGLYCAQVERPRRNPNYKWVRKHKQFFALQLL